MICIDPVSRYNREFAVTDLSEIDKHYFEKLCVRLLGGQTVKRGLAEIECSEHEFVIYNDPDSKAFIMLRLWSNMLSLHVVNTIGTWIVNSNVNGMPIQDAIDFLWLQLVAGLAQLNKLHGDIRCAVKNILEHSDIGTDEDAIIAYMLDIESRYKDSCGPNIVTRDELEKQLDLSTYHVKKALKSLRTKGFINLITIGGYSQEFNQVWSHKGYRTTTLIDNDKRYSTIKHLYELQNEIDLEDMLSI